MQTDPSGEMNRHRISLVAFLLLIALAQHLVEPAYVGYAAAFAALTLRRLVEATALQRLIRPTIWRLALCIWLVLMAFITYVNDPLARDVLRDVGALLTFFIGRHILFSRYDPVQQTLKALSDAGVWIVTATLVAACLAYLSGADAYKWRGEFIPPSHSWLPYVIAANYALALTEQSRVEVYVRRIVWCIGGTIAALSRTDLALEAFFLLFLLLRYLPFLLTNRIVFRRALYGLGLSALLLPPLLGLDVVKERIDISLAEDDSSVGWRVLENTAVFAFMQSAGIQEWLFGFGFGARVPLPEGIVDFNDNSSIPHLHNSFLTILVKFGVAGVAALLIFVARQAFRSSKFVSPELMAIHSAGRWIVLFVLAKAITLQGLSEWSHILFFGLGCALMTYKHRLRNVRVISEAPSNILLVDNSKG